MGQVSELTGARSLLLLGSLSENEFFLSENSLEKKKSLILLVVLPQNFL